MRKVLIASPVRQKPAILQEFLWSLGELKQTGLKSWFAFVDDNDDPESSRQLRDFASQREDTLILRGEPGGEGLGNEISHAWSETLMWKVAVYKDRLIRLAESLDCDYIFFVDSDLVVQPDTLLHLLSLERDIVAEVFWTVWGPGYPPLPQVWLGGQYELYTKRRDEIIDASEMLVRQGEFLDRLKMPGTYRVGGLGACTLISRRAIATGVSFQEIYNLSLRGEDRHFCVRAAALGFTLYADTHYPAFHIYRESELAGLHRYKLEHFAGYQPPKQRLALGMLVKNEAGKFLETILRQMAPVADSVVIVDDASSDGTVGLCRRLLAGVPHVVQENPAPGFHNEIALRKQLWQLLVSQNPDWILILDADEVFEEGITAAISEYLTNPFIDIVKFRLYDMWDDEHYRDDAFWYAHRTYRPFMVRYKPDADAVWQETPLHCGRFPVSALGGACLESELRIQHFGWRTPELRQAKYQRYITLDPDGKYGSREQYDSILAERPRLIKWDGSQCKLIGIF